MLAKRSIILLLAAAAIAAPAAASAGEPPAQPRQDGRDVRQDQRGPRQAPPEFICRSVEIAGANAMPMVCMTAAEWRRAEQ